MAKVKKTTAVTGVRNVRASKKSAKRIAKKAAPAKDRKPVTAGRKSRTGTAAKRATAGRGSTKRATRASTTRGGSTAKVKSMSAARPKARVAVPAVRVAVKPLEPHAKCGPGTSVQYLFRVDETVDGRTTAHLVFFDRHGWYCEHGRNCPAVAHAKKYQGHIARAS